MVQYFPLSEFHKSPRGAVKVNEPVSFRLTSELADLREVYIVLQKDGETPVWYGMSRGETADRETAEFFTTLHITTRGLYFYHFVAVTQGEKHYIGCGADLCAAVGNGGAWQLTVYEETFAAPVWQQGGAYYQIMPDRFFCGGERLSTQKTAVYRDDWGGVPEYKPDASGKIRNHDFFGGNLKGITQKLAYLKSLNITCLYLNPIFWASSNHKYDTGSYLRIDPDFGTEDDLKELIRKAAKKGIRIMLDGVFSHTGDDSVYFNKYGSFDSVGAYQSKDSPYASWYAFRDFPDDYVCWWGIKTLPNTVETDTGYLEFICGTDGVLRRWTDLGLGGWRLDVADELPDGFLDRAVRAVKSKNPDALVLGEVWEDASDKISYGNRRRYLQGGQLDSVTNYPFKEGIAAFLKTGNAQQLANAVHTIVDRYPKSALDNLMNLLGTHDTVRILTALGDSGQTKTRDDRAKARLTDRAAAVQKLRSAAVLQYTLPGCPCVYYGDEAGVEGFEDPFNRRCYPWGNADKAVIKWYRRLGKVRAENRSVYADGAFTLIAAQNGVFAFKRANENGALITVVNNGAENYPYDDGKKYEDLLTNKPFNGGVAAGAAVILRETTG